MLVSAVNLIFFTAEGLMLAHIILSWLRVGAGEVAWIRHPVVLWIDDAGDRLLRPFRRLFDALGVSRLTGSLDLSPILAFAVVRWLHGAALSAIVVGALPPR